MGCSCSSPEHPPKHSVVALHEGLWQPVLVDLYNKASDGREALRTEFVRNALAAVAPTAKIFLCFSHALPCACMYQNRFTRRSRIATSSSGMRRPRAGPQRRLLSSTSSCRRCSSDAATAPAAAARGSTAIHTHAHDLHECSDLPCMMPVCCAYQRVHEDTPD